MPPSSELTPEILLIFAILLAAITLFISERLRMDLVALLVLGALALSGLVSPDEALSGFSNPAVVTVWGMFILSAGLAKTGLAGLLGQQITRFSGKRPGRLVFIIMLVSAVLSAFMNNIGVVAMLLPVVLDVARRTQQSPSKLLMPLAFSTMMGGMLTSIGNPANILVTDSLLEAGYHSFGIFDYAPAAGLFTLAGILLMLLSGSLLLPEHKLQRELAQANGGLQQAFALQERLFVVRIPEDSSLNGKTLAESHLGSALSLNVTGIIRDGHTRLAPTPEIRLQGGDRLLVTGRPDKLKELGNGSQLTIEPDDLKAANLTSKEVQLAEVGLSPRSPLIGQTLEGINFRGQYHVNVLAIWRENYPIRTNLQNIALKQGDVLLVQASTAQLEMLRSAADFMVSTMQATEVYRLHERLLLICIPSDSNLAGKTLAESHLADAFGFSVLGIIREGHTNLMPPPSEVLRVDDKLVVEGKEEDVSVFRGLQNLQIDEHIQPIMEDMESEQIGMVEIALSPQSKYSGKTLRQINFREKYGLSVLAIWRGGRAFRFNLRDMEIRFGDALLIYGSRARLKLLAGETDFLVLTEEIKDPPRIEKAPLAALLMLAVIVSAGVGLLPIALSVVIGGALMVLTGCLTMDEAYNAIEWRAIFLVAGMLPLGIAMQNTGAASLLAGLVSGVALKYGPLLLLGLLYVLATAATQFMPNSVVVVLITPIALTTAAQMGLSPFPLMLALAFGASSTFLSPVGHPANVLVMGPGGYRFKDYYKLGLPLTILGLVITLLVLPKLWPLM